VGAEQQRWARRAGSCVNVVGRGGLDRLLHPGVDFVWATRPDQRQCEQGRPVDITDCSPCSSRYAQASLQ
jgi:hypothetical protein